MSRLTSDADASLSRRYNAWCKGACKTDPTVRLIDTRIADATGFSHQNMESYQIIKYTEAQEYQSHSDWIPDQAKMQPGPRLFTLFFWLSDVAEGGGGATWFPQATVNSTDSQLYWKYEKLNAYYRRWNNPKQRPNMVSTEAIHRCSDWGGHF